jgi:signal peptidase I
MSQDQLRTTPESAPPTRPLTQDGSPPRGGKVATASASKARPSVPEVKDTWREVVETIVFVVVLVLLLKSFTAEAFVIPTGSMAETLWGYQKLVTCPECTYEFPVNCSMEVEGKHLTKVTDCVCPNCRLKIFFDDKLNPSCNTGDRVLVAKHLNDLHVLDLERLDVVVFKFPEEPQRDFVPMNYIKRLIGLPGETIGILNGDIYIAKNVPYEKFVVEEVLGSDKVKVRIEDAQGRLGDPETLKVAPDPLVTRDQQSIHLELRDLEKGDRGVLSRDPRDGAVDGLQVYRDLPVRRQTHKNYPTAVRLLKEEHQAGKEPVFQILRKPPDKVLALRRIVYDNNHQAKDLLKKKGTERWAPEKDDPNSAPDFQKFQEKRERAPKDGWTSDGKFGFEHKSNTRDEIDWLRYRHLIVDRRSYSPPEPLEITDFMGYNSSDARNWVGDLILELKAEVKEASGEIILELSKGDDRFQARWDLSTGTCRLMRVRNGSAEELAKKETNLKKPGTYRLRFANVDERLTVWVDGSLPFGHGVPYEPIGDRSINDKAKGNDLEPASIGVRGGAVNVSDLTLWRDTYYTNSEGAGTFTLYVQPGHYLCMGDNSPASSDSRSWGRQDSGDSRGGLVPERLMLGRALLVYWPFWPAHNRVGPIK